MFHQSHVLSCPTKLNGNSPLPVSHIGIITRRLLPIFLCLSLKEINQLNCLKRSVILVTIKRLKATMTQHLTNAFLCVAIWKIYLHNLTLKELALPVFIYFDIFAKTVPNMQDFAARICKLVEALFFVMADEGVLSPGLWPTFCAGTQSSSSDVPWCFKDPVFLFCIIFSFRHFLFLSIM